VSLLEQDSDMANGAAACCHALLQRSPVPSPSLEVLFEHVIQHPTHRLATWGTTCCSSKPWRSPTALSTPLVTLLAAQIPT
jgi:hypothetical protein